MLRSFQDLVRIFTLHPAKYDAIYFPRKTVLSDYDKLFDIIRKGNHKSDEDVTTELYGAADTKSSTRYFTLKSRLKDRIENGFFFLSTERFSTRNARRYAAWKEQIVIWVLWNSGAKATAAQRMEKLAEEAEIYGWNDVLVRLYRSLRLYYAREGSMVLLKKYDALLQQAKEREAAEIQAEMLLAEIEVFKARETILGKEHEEQCRKAESIIRELLGKIPEHTGQYLLRKYAADASLYLAEAEQALSKTLAVLGEKEQVMKRFPDGIEQEEHSVLDTEKLPYCLLTKNFPEAKQASERLLGYLLPEMPETLIVYEYYFLTAMHTCSFRDAAQIFESAMQIPAMKRFEEGNSAKWRLFEVYLRLMLDGEMSHRPTYFKPRFSMNKFLADVPPYSEERIAYNVAWILAQMVQCISDGDREEAEKRGDDLLVYHEKYLRKDTPQYRLQCFLRMVNTAVLCNFDVQTTLRKTHKHCLWLTEARAFDSVKTGYTEVLPFEYLWSLLLFRMKYPDETPLTTLPNILQKFPEPLHYYNPLQ